MNARRGEEDTPLHLAAGNGDTRAVGIENPRYR